MITKRRKGSGMSAELEEKKQKLEAKKNAVQEAYKKSAYKEDFHSWIQNSTWGGPLNTGEFRMVGFSEDEIQQKIEQKKQNDASVRELFWNNLSQQAPFSTNFMCQVHKMLYHGIIYFGGMYRFDNVRMDRVAIKPARPEQIYERMKQMEENYRQSPKGVLDILKLNYDIVITQPFIDGNKTLSRTMMNYELLNQGYPPLLFSQPEDKVKYINTLEQSHLTKDLNAFYDFMLSKMQTTLNQSFNILNSRLVQEPQKIVSSSSFSAAQAASQKTYE